MVGGGLKTIWSFTGTLRFEDGEAEGAGLTRSALVVRRAVATNRTAGRLWSDIGMHAGFEVEFVTEDLGRRQQK